MFVVAFAAQLTLIAADQMETIKFLPGGEVATHLSKITSALSALPNTMQIMLYGSLRRFYEARLEARQEVLIGFEQNVRVMELMKSSPFCRLLFSHKHREGDSSGYAYFSVGRECLL